MPEFLVNANGFQLGLPEKGDVGLPPWAKGSPDLFISKHREALESEYHSRRIKEGDGEMERENQIKTIEFFIILTKICVNESTPLDRPYLRTQATGN